jgi:hypothetical protein
VVHHLTLAVEHGVTVTIIVMVEESVVIGAVIDIDATGDRVLSRVPELRVITVSSVRAFPWSILMMVIGHDPESHSFRARE